MLRGGPPTKSPIQSYIQLADAKGDGGVSRNDDGFVSASGISAVIDLKLQQSGERSDSSAHHKMNN